MTIFEGLPSTWTLTTLGDIAVDIRYGLTATAQPDIEGVFYLRISDINDYGEVDQSGGKYIEFTDELERYLLEPGDIVIARSGSVGRSYVYQGSPDPWVFASYLIRFRIDQVAADPSYIGLYLRSPYYWHYVNATARTAAQPNINSRELARLPIPLPTLAEQRRIIEILRVANEIRQLRRQAAHIASRLEQSIYHEMFDDGLDWTECKIGDIVLSIEAGKNIAAQPYPAREDHWGILKVSAVTYGAFQPHENKELPRDVEPVLDYEVRRGDLLVTRANTVELVGASAMVRDTPPKLMLPDKLWRLTPDDSRVNRYYLYGLLNTPDLRREISRRASGTSSSMKNISQQKFLDIDVSIPPIELQKVYEERIRVLWETVVDNSTSAQSVVENLMDSLTSRAFSGELTERWRINQGASLGEAALLHRSLLDVKRKESTLREIETEQVTLAEREDLANILTNAIQPALAQLAESVELPSLVIIESFYREWLERLAEMVEPAINRRAFQSSLNTGVLNAVLRSHTSQYNALAEVSRTISASFASAPMPTEVRSILDAVLAATRWIDEWPPHDHPRYAVASQLSLDQKFIILACERQGRYFTLADIQEELDAPTDTVRRGLELLSSLGLIIPVTVPATSAEQGSVYTLVYRLVRDDDDVRLIDLGELSKLEDTSS